MISRTRVRQKSRVGGRLATRSGIRSRKHGEMLKLLNRHSTEMLEMVQEIEEARSQVSGPRSPLAPIFDELARVVFDHVENLEDCAAVLRKQPASQ